LLLQSVIYNLYQLPTALPWAMEFVYLSLRPSPGDLENNNLMRTLKFGHLNYSTCFECQNRMDTQHGLEGCGSPADLNHSEENRVN